MIIYIYIYIYIKKSEQQNNPKRWIYCDVNSTLNISVSITIIRTLIPGKLFTQRWMLVEITGPNKMYTTKRYKLLNWILNLKVLSTCLAFFVLMDLDPYLLSYIYIYIYCRHTFLGVNIFNYAKGFVENISRAPFFLVCVISLNGLFSLDYNLFFFSSYNVWKLVRYPAPVSRQPEVITQFR